MAESFAPAFDIAGRRVGQGAPCYVIAEAGSNHDGSLDQALRLIDVAAEAGADAVKFQVFSAETIVWRREDELTRFDFAQCRTAYELFKKNEMPRAWLPTLMRHASHRGIDFLATPFDEQAVDDLCEIGVAALKIASFELNHFPLLRHTAATGMPVLLSTGMATLGEVSEALAVLAQAGCGELGLFHCGIGYPFDLKDVNLRAMGTLAQTFGTPAGYSDHTPGTAVAAAAAALGASLFEKHFTLDRGLAGPDHAFALEPAELRGMVRAIRDVESALGNPVKGPADSELQMRRRGFRSVYVRTPIAQGEVITEDKLMVLRPAAGLHPRHLPRILGGRAARALCPNEPLNWDDLDARPSDEDGN